MANKRALEPPQMTILSDHPILRVDEEKERREPDSFTLHSRLGAVYDIIRHKNTRPPLAIAVYGDWGTGKSSAMRWLGDQLGEWSGLSKAKRGGHFRVRTVWFDPWKYTKREDVWRGLIAEVILKAIDVKGASLQTVTKAARDFGLFLGRSFLNALAAVKLKVGGEANVGVGKAKGEAAIDLAALTKIADDYRQTTQPEKAYLNEFETALREWVKASLANDERMVIFIDDLDRCLPKVVLEVLEALKLYLNIPQLIFVVGLDREVVETVVKKHYSDHGLGESKAEHYLDKMFQVEVDIPPSQKQMEDYLSRQIEEMDKSANGYWSNSLTGWNEDYKRVIEEKVATLAEDNPREIKRLLNSTLLRGTAAARDDELGNSAEQRFTQGCQVYLMQRVLRRYVPQSGGLLREQKALEFFEQWSQFIQLYPGYRQREAQMEREPVAETAERRTEKPGDDEVARAYDALRAALPRYPDTKEPYPLLDQRYLWDLLAIPFSVAVAAAAPIESPEVETEPVAAVEPRAESRPGVVQPARADLESMPRGVRSAIARALNKHVDALTADDLRSVADLDLSGSELSDLTPLAGLTGLTTLYLSETRVSDLTPLAGLTGLTTLNLSGTQISDLTPLTGLTGLTELHLSKTQVSDLTPLAELAALTKVDIGRTQVSNLTPLAALRALTWLRLMNMKVTDLTPLQDLRLLEYLDLDGTTAIDLKPIADLATLTRLDLRRSKVTDLTPLAGLTGLTSLNLINTQVADLTPLAGLVNLRHYEGPPIPGHPRFGPK